LARKAGVKRISGEIYNDLRECLKGYLETIVACTFNYTEYYNRKTVATKDVVQACKKKGKVIYGYRFH